MTARHWILGLATCICLAGAACGNDPASPTETGGGTTAQLTAVDFAFSPTSLEVEPGAEVTLTFTNDDTADHSFTSTDIAVDLVVGAGEVDSITFTAPDADTEFHCRFHASMTGTITTGATSSGGGGTDSGTDEDPGYDY